MEFAQTGVGPIKEFSKTPETTPVQIEPYQLAAFPFTKITRYREKRLYRVSLEK